MEDGLKSYFSVRIDRVKEIVPGKAGRHGISFAYSVLFHKEKKQFIVMDFKKKRARRYIFSKNADRFFASIYDAARFIGHFFREVFLPPFEFNEIIRQCFQVGYKSLPLITLTGFITGL